MSRTTRIIALSCGTALSAVALGAAPAHAVPDMDVFDKNDTAWACEEEGGLPVDHCFNAKSQGNTRLIKVLPPDVRWPQEGWSSDPKADSRPCPHDPMAIDGTWWTPPGAEGFWVCHHRPARG